MKKITWKKAKGGRAFENILEGFVEGQLSFVKEGGLCLTDLRDMRSIKHYPLNKEGHKEFEAKLIAHELLNSINLEQHEASRKEMEDRNNKTADLIREAQTLLDKLKNNKI